MDQDAVTPRQAILRQQPGFLDELAEAETRLEQFHIVLHLFLRDGVEHALFVVAPSVAAQPGPGNIGAIAVGADQIGVETDDVAGLDGVAAAFLEPRIGARPGRKQAGLDPFRSAADRSVPEGAPKLQFGHARFQRRPRVVQRVQAGRHRPPHGLDLFGGFDAPGDFDDRLGIDHLEIVAFEGVNAGRRAVVERQPAVAAAMAVDQVGDFGRPFPVNLGQAAAAMKEIGAGGRPDFVDRDRMGAQMPGVVEFEQDDRPFGRHEGVTGRIVHDPDLHIGRIGQVPDVERIEQHHPGDVRLAHLGAHALDPVALDGRQVGRIEPARRPAGLDRLAIADNVAVQLARFVHLPGIAVGERQGAIGKGAIGQGATGKGATGGARQSGVRRPGIGWSGHRRSPLKGRGSCHFFAGPASGYRLAEFTVRTAAGVNRSWLHPASRRHLP